MPKFDIKNYLETIYGPAGPDNALDDESLKKGLSYVTSRMIANLILEGIPKENLSVNGATSALIDNHEDLKKLFCAYPTNKLKNYKNFLGDGKIFYEKTKEGQNLLRDIQSYTGGTTNRDLDVNRLVFTVAMDMMTYYYKSGATLYTEGNKDAHRYDMFIYDSVNPSSFFKDKNGNDILTQAQKDRLLQMKSRLENENPTREMQEKIFKDYLTGKEENVNLHALDFTDAEKKALKASLSVDDVLSGSKNIFNKILNIETVSEYDKNYHDSYAMNHPGERDQGDYRFFRIHKALSADILDKNNVKKLIELAQSIQDIHMSRSKWTRFWGYYGKVGKENKAVDDIKNYLVSKGLSKRVVDDAVKGNQTAMTKLLKKLPTVDERINEQKLRDEHNLQVVMQLTDGEVHQLQELACNPENDTITVCGAALEKDDIAMFVRPETVAEFAPKISSANANRNNKHFRPMIEEADRQEIEEANEISIIQDDFANLPKEKNTEDILELDENEEVDERSFFSDEDVKEVKAVKEEEISTSLK